MEDVLQGLGDREQPTNAIIPRQQIQNKIEEIMKNIKKRKDGRYEARLQMNKKRVSVYGRTLIDVNNKLKKLTKTIHTIERKTKYTFADWCYVWLETYKKRYLKYKQFVELEKIMKELSVILGNYNLTSISTGLVQSMYNNMPRSRKKEKCIIYLNACMQKAVDLGYININVVKNIVKDKKIKTIKAPFSVEQQEKILVKIKGSSIECYIYLLLLTGLRKSEIDNNILSNLDEANNQLRAINEKQREDISYKYIDLSPGYVQLLKQQALAGKFCLKPDLVYRRFKRLLNELGINGDLHTLRHTFATNYYYLGVPEKIIQAWCGHKTLDVTRDVYIGLTRDNIKERLYKLYNNLLYNF